MSDMWKMVLFVCGSIITVAGAAGVVWWLVKPRIAEWVERELIQPVRETHHQVTVNHHSSDEPTILDRLDTLTASVGAQAQEFESLHANVTGLTHVVIEHLRARPAGD